MLERRDIESFRAFLLGSLQHFLANDAARVASLEGTCLGSGFSEPDTTKAISERDLKAETTGWPTPSALSVFVAPSSRVVRVVVDCVPVLSVVLVHSQY